MQQVFPECPTKTSSALLTSVLLVLGAVSDP